MTLDLLTPAERPPAVPLFVELCAGTAALSLRLQQVGARPPISRMGAKTGYADAILAALGLAPGMKAACYLWCEPDDGARAMLMSYALPSLRQEAAEIILSWKDEDPRALWERLRAEGPIKGADGREVARHVVIQGWRLGAAEAFRHPYGGKSASGRNGGGCDGLTRDGMVRRLSSLPSQPPTATTPDARAIDPREVARFLTQPESVDPDEWPEVVICADGAMVDAREVARWAALQSSQFGGLAVSEVDGEIRAIPQDGRPRVLSWDMGGFKGTRGGTAAALATNVSALPAPWPPTTITADARDLAPPTLPPGTVVFVDPPYQDTTGYAHDLPRTEVLTIAHCWADAGATVVISEAVPLGSIVHEGIADAEPGPLEGWHCYEITGCRVGQKRTFSAQQREWLTMSRPADKAWAAGLALANRQARNASETEPARETLELFG